MRSESAWPSQRVSRMTQDTLPPWIAGAAWLWPLGVALANTGWGVTLGCPPPGFGRAPHATGDDSREVPWLAPCTLGEAYHNTHHRFPRSARHGLAGGPDLSWVVIRGLERLGLVSNVWLPKHAR